MKAKIKHKAVNVLA